MRWGVGFGKSSASCRFKCIFLSQPLSVNPALVRAACVGQIKTADIRLSAEDQSGAPAVAQNRHETAPALAT